MVVSLRQSSADFDAFWKKTLTETRKHPLKAKFARVDCGLRTVETFDATFAGYGGQPIKAWLLLPRHRTGKLPAVVEYIGYGGGRGFPTDWLTWSAAGYAHLVMDTRGQGSSWSIGDTPDPEPEGSNPQFSGFMTRGVLNPKTYNHYPGPKEIRVWRYNHHEGGGSYQTQEKLKFLNQLWMKQEKINR